MVLNNTLSVARRPNTKLGRLSGDDRLIGKVFNDDLVENYSKGTLLRSNRSSSKGSKQKSLGIFPGTYLADFGSENLLPFRSIMTFTKDRDVFFMDSIQGGVKGIVNPFGQTHGTWKPTRNGEIAATALNFSYPTEEKPATVNRSDMRMKFNPQGQTVKGTITVRLFDLQQDPLTPSIPATATYTFTGRRLVPLDG